MMKEIITGVYTKSPNGDYWFIDPEGEKWFYIHLKNTDKAISWDTVEAYLKEFRWKKEAVITKIIKRWTNLIVWKLDIKSNFAFVVPLDNKYVNDIYVWIDKLQKFEKSINIRLKQNDIVAVRVTKWTTKNPEWLIVDFVWKQDEKNLELKTLIISSWIKTRFDTETVNETLKIKFEIPPKRTDLSQKLTFTIDWEDAKDLDDAIIIEKIKDKYKLFVCIADVAEYVKNNSFLDKEAKKRWNSTYLVDRVIPMLPEKLSNDLCSLNPNTQKLSLVCEIDLDGNWEVIDSKVYEWIIVSKFRLTYKEVQEIIDKKINIWDTLKFWWILTGELEQNLFLAYELKNIIKKNREKYWVLDFDFPEIKIITDWKNNVIDIKKYESYESNKLIERFMVLANESVSKLFSKYPFVYRIHPEPSDEDIEKLRNILNIFDIKLPYKKITPKLISQVLISLKDNKNKNLISTQILRSLSKAIYSDENEGHFGLALEYYSHFTSPIRRYADLLIHRIIKQKIHNKLDTKSINIYKNSLKETTKHITDTEKKSEKLEYDVKDLMICKYYENKIWEKYTCNIVSMIEAWVFISLSNSVEWFIPKDSLANWKSYVFDNSKMQFAVWKNIFKLWDELKVILKEIDFLKRRLIFDILT